MRTTIHYSTTFCFSSCVCEDYTNLVLEDKDQCDAGEEGYKQEYECEGDSCKYITTPKKAAQLFTQLSD